MISPEQLKIAKNEVTKTGLSLEKAIEKLGIITEEGVAGIIANELKIPFINLKDYLIDQELIKLIPEALARRYTAVPIFKIGDVLTIATLNPRDIEALDQIRLKSGCRTVEPVLSTASSINKAIDEYYGVSAKIDEVVKGYDKGNSPSIKPERIAEETPIIKLVNIIIMDAVRDRASDIHIEPEAQNLRIRYRVDGIMHEENTLPKYFQDAVITRIKILASMDIAEKRKPQDGRISLKLHNKSLDLRVSTFPTVFGENVVIRILDETSVILGLEELGFTGEHLEAFKKIIRRTFGIFLVTGPTGSGKTSTLYSALTNINSMEKNIITIEDPVEYQLPLIRQTQVNPKADITFATGLRNILRQDPDIIMIGEIRDKETVEIAIQAALTGHLVLSTLHTNDATTAVTRLIDMGVEPFLISSTVIGALAQRLVRKICPKCKEEFTSAKGQLKSFGIDEELKIYRGRGCPNCKGTGFLGRAGIFELFIPDETIKNMIIAKSSSEQIRAHAVSAGMVTLMKDGIRKVKSGITTPEEVLRVIQD